VSDEACFQQSARLFLGHSFAANIRSLLGRSYRNTNSSIA
jgi:hypothetical protein